MGKILLTFILFTVWFFSFPQNIQAARSLSITSDKLSVFGDEEMVITASASGFTTDEQILIKGAFYQEGSTNYFGYTKNVDSWIKNGDPTVNQLSIKIGNWDGTIKVKTDFLDGGYKGEGDYKFKIGFYYTTSGGNLSSVNWSNNILTVTISEPDPTPTPTPTAPSAPTSTPVSTPISTPLKTPNPSPTKSPTTKPTPSPSPVNSSSPEVLAESTSEPIPTHSSTPTVESVRVGKPPVLAFILLGFGVLFISLSAFLAFKMRYNNLHEGKNNSSS